ncbi:MAG: secretin N-terminal domain-containing protein [Thermoanaerobaculaceae bacterium]
MKRALPVLVLAVVVSTVVVSTAATADLEDRVVQLRHRPAREAAAMVEPMLSPLGSVLIQPGSNTVTVRDRPEIAQRIAEALTAWDIVRQDYRVRVRLLMASTAPLKPGQAAAKLDGFGAELTGLFRWSGFEEIDAFEIQAREGVSVESKAARGYTLRFELRTVLGEPQRVQLAPCEIARIEGQEQGIGLQRRLHRSNVSLQLGQTFILVTARSEEAKKALVVILGADRETAR